MLFSMNTIAFAEEVAVDEADAVLETADVVAEDTADATLAEATLCATHEEYFGGMKYSYDDVKGEWTCLTTINYDKDPNNKKATVADVATITNVDDPVSWNGAYAAGLINTVLNGTNNEDTWLNNGSTVGVSENSKPSTENFPIEYRDADENWRYSVVPVKDGEAYLFVGYGLDDNFFVEGTDDPVQISPTGVTGSYSLPCTEWDGRKVDFNKSGINKYAKGKREALDVKVALVKYSGGTLTEIPGVEANVKVDQKNQKAASVEAVVTPVLKTLKFDRDLDGKLDDVPRAVNEHKKIGELPFFTLSAKVKGKDAKAYAKDIKTALGKEEYNKYSFGIVQKTVVIDDDAVLTNEGTNIINQFKGKYDTKTDEKGKTTGITVSDGNIKEIEENIAKALTDGKYFDADEEELKFSDNDFKITNFTGDKGKATITIYGTMGDKKKGYTWEEIGTLKEKTDYEFAAGKVGGADVKALDFKGSYVYKPLDYTGSVDTDKNLIVTPSVPTTTNSLSSLGYKWAFRQSPVEKSKKFRHGIYLSDGQGFVFSVED